MMSTRHKNSLLVFSLIAAVTAPAFAQEAPAASDMQTVVVTGTYAKNRRSADSESPIDIIGAK